MVASYQFYKRAKFVVGPTTTYPTWIAIWLVQGLLLDAHH